MVVGIFGPTVGIFGPTVGIFGPTVRLKLLSINILSLCLWVKFTIDKDLTCCVSGTYPPHFCRPEKSTWNVPTLHLFPQSSWKAPAEFRFRPPFGTSFLREPLMRPRPATLFRSLPGTCIKGNDCGEESLQASSPQSQSYQASRVLRACGA